MVVYYKMYTQTNGLNCADVNSQSLPYHAKRIYIKFYERAKQIYGSDKIACRVAWSAVKRKYYQLRNGKWVPYADDNDFDTTTTDSESDDSESDT